MIFCLFAPDSSAPTPPCSLRNSPEKEAAGWMRRGAAQRAAPPLPNRRSAGSSASGGAVNATAQQPAAGAGQHPAAPPSRGPAGGLPRIPSSSSTASSSHSSFEGSDLLPCASQELSEDDGSAAAYALQRSGGSFSFAPLPRLGAGGAGEEDCPFSPAPLRRLPSMPKHEGCLVLKFVSSRLICQSEQFASELTRHVGLCVPESRILRQQVGWVLPRYCCRARSMLGWQPCVCGDCQAGGLLCAVRLVGCVSGLRGIVLHNYITPLPAADLAIIP